ncbi:hypothetical protein NAF17_16665 [Mucilaginibacter sp. RB4R14]|uniref:hypothetical protein n=1 Tax=Mucilaginibacter aurantiaciroseus TaxID=2949308 RepID=UPI00209135F6|nr:hypothetical protein [Mucilaginibacter aurantiaciroseus]MCO5937180.1 hypothetical protein [Mucilaginibacter aurantiaciroseus]
MGLRSIATFLTSVGSNLKAGVPGVWRECRFSFEVRAYGERALKTGRAGGSVALTCPFLLVRPLSTCVPHVPKQDRYTVD